MANGMEYLVRAILSQLDPATREALENIPTMVRSVAERQGRIEAALVRIEAKIDGHTLRLQALQSHTSPAYTPDHNEDGHGCVYSDAAGPCTLPMGHPGEHICEMVGIEYWDNGQPPRRTITDGR